MAANPKPPVALDPSSEKHYHVYHAEAEVLSGHLKHPIDQPIEKYARVELYSRRADHITQTVQATTLEGLITFKSGQTRISGSQLQNKRDLWGKIHSGWVTLSTSVIEGLNVFDVITADRVVAQSSTEHVDVQDQDPMHVPKVTFLGTRFENLRVAGYPVEVELNLGFCGSKPEDDRPYVQDTAFLDRVKQQLDEIADAKDLPETLETNYKGKVTSILDLKRRIQEAKGNPLTGQNGYAKLQCSLVKSIGPIPIPGVRTFGNVIVIPDFGTVSLAELEVGTEPSHDVFGSTTDSGSSNYFMLSMLNMQMGCIGGGNAVAAQTKLNGNTKP
jgi:hypothetical protein